MVALVIAFPNIIAGATHQQVKGGVVEVPVDGQGYGDYYLPKEWR